MNVNIVKLDPEVRIPSYATDGAACFDIYANESKWLATTDSTIIKTGLKIEVPDGHVLMVFSRSGHGFKDEIRLGNCTGIIDSDYRGELMVKLRSDSRTNNKFFNKYDAIAQGMILPVEKVAFSEVTELSTTKRGEGGFGSTGS